MKLAGKQIGLIVLAGMAGIFLAVWAYRTRYGRKLLAPVAKLESMLAGNPTPAQAQPRYLGFGGGEYFDPSGIWPYGSNSNYQLYLNTNSGIPTSQTPSSAVAGTTANAQATAITRPISSFNGFGGGGGMGNGNAMGLSGNMSVNGGGGGGR